MSLGLFLGGIKNLLFSQRDKWLLPTRIRMDQMVRIGLRLQFLSVSEAKIPLTDVYFIIWLAKKYTTQRRLNLLKALLGMGFDWHYFRYPRLMTNMKKDVLFSVF